MDRYTTRALKSPRPPEMRKGLQSMYLRVTPLKLQRTAQATIISSPLRLVDMDGCSFLKICL